MIKAQTAERMELLQSLLGQQLQEKKYDKERIQKMTELCQLLKEDVEIGEQTSEVFDDIVAIGQDTLETPKEDKNVFLKTKESELIEYYNHLKNLG